MVVNHGHRESVEFFEVFVDENTVSMIWRGCVLAPDQEFHNDVVALADGGFIVSNRYRTVGMKIFGFHPGTNKALPGMDSGYLLVASQNGSMLELRSCVHQPEETCLLPFEIVQIDPETMECEVVFRQEGPPMGIGTVAVQINDDLLIGSFLGDRMIVTPYSVG